MGFHGCPIEPSDWADGPDDPEEDACPECDGTGLYSRPECVVDGAVYPAILDKTCDRCEGSGYVEAEPYEPDPEIDWFV